MQLCLGSVEICDKIGKIGGLFRQALRVFCRILDIKEILTVRFVIGADFCRRAADTHEYLKEEMK